jgi:hypothetical protein
LRLNHERAVRNRRIGAGFLCIACSAFFLGACAAEGILPKAELPPAPAVQQPFPTFAPRDGADEERGVLTPAEREAMEARLTRLAKERESGVTRRIDKSK